MKDFVSKKSIKQRETLGKQVVDAFTKAPNLDHSAAEQAHEMMKDGDYERLLFETVDSGCQKYEGDFFVEVTTIKQGILKMVIYNKFVNRISCPTPTYDQAVFHYHRKEEHLEFLWILPSKDTYNMMIDRWMDIPEEEKGLLQFVLDDSAGMLLVRSKVLNGESLEDKFDKVLVMLDEKK